MHAAAWGFVAAVCVAIASVPQAHGTHNITFNPPVYLGHVSWGVTDTIDFDSKGSFAVVVKAVKAVKAKAGATSTARTLVSHDGGVTYKAATATAPLSTNTIAVQGQHPAVHDFGNASVTLHSPEANYWALQDGGAGALQAYSKPTPVVFEGLPMHLRCDAKYGTSISNYITSIRPRQVSYWHHDLR